MSWEYVKWAAAVLLVLILIIATNLIDRRNFQQLGAAIETIYQDRLIAKDLLFETSLLVNQKTLAFAKKDSSYFKSENTLVNEKIERHLASYGNTKLTQKEEEMFNLFRLKFEELKKVELNHQDISFFEEAEIPSLLEEVDSGLYELSKLQVEEGKNEMLTGKLAINSIEFLTQLEIYCLIALAILVQVLLFNSFRKSNKTTSNA